MVHLAWILPLAALFVPAMIAVVLFLQIKALSRPDLELVPADRGRFAAAIADSQSHDAWFTKQGFTLVACSRLNAMRGALITAWQHTERPTYVCIYHTANQRNYDFVTMFANDVVLTTGSTTDGMLLPSPPGGYTQCFADGSLQRLWQKHVDAERYLLDNGAVALPAIDRPFKEVFVDAVRRGAEHVRTIPFWPLRGTYWYFVRRRRLVNRSIPELVAMGVYQKPGHWVP